MQWSVAVDIIKRERIETDYVACRSLKCDQRNIRYKQPTVELVPSDGHEDKPLTATEIEQSKIDYFNRYEAEVEACFEDTNRTLLQPLINKVEGLILEHADKPKRKYTRKDVKG
jgi:hypothetical protein